MFLILCSAGKTPDDSDVEFAVAIDLDATLLDRVFQPLCDAFALWASPFGMARGALVLAVESQALPLFWNVLKDRSVFSATLSSMAAVLTLIGAQQAWRLIAKAERESRGNTMNVRRITLRRQRMTWLAVCTGCSALLLQDPDIRAAFSILSCLAWVALIYLVSCTPRPQARQRMGRLAAATVPAR